MMQKSCIWFYHACDHALLKSTESNVVERSGRKSDGAYYSMRTPLTCGYLDVRQQVQAIRDTRNKKMVEVWKNCHRLDVSVDYIQSQHSDNYLKRNAGSTPHLQNIAMPTISEYICR